MRLLGRYVFREILTSAVLGTLLATFIIFLREADKLFAILVGANNPPVVTVVSLLLWAMPPVLPLTIPFGVLVGILIGLGRMASDGEIIAMRAAGVSSRQVIAPVAHSYGTNLVTVIMTTSGSLTNGGANTVTNSFLLGVAPINHAPVINLVTNFTVLENATNVTATVNVWDYDLQASNFIFTATAGNSLAAVAVTQTNVLSLSNAVM